jgi:hypothetical protein
MEEKKFGIDLIKKAIKFIYDSTLEGIEDLRDSKLSLGEILGFGDNLYAGITITMKWKELVQQVKDVDSEEGFELTAYVGELIKDVTGDDVDIIVTNAIEAIESEIAIYEKNIVPIIEIMKK